MSLMEEESMEESDTLGEALSNAAEYALSVGRQQQAIEWAENARKVEPIGEIALIPATGGLFSVQLTYKTEATDGASAEVREVLLWDRKSEGGFPEARILKQRVRNHIEPGRDLGHSDKPSTKGGSGVANQGGNEQQAELQTTSTSAEEGHEQSAEQSSGRADCEDCK
ncbi:hypothetical protein MBLNU459_g4856t1 [Dothideomycetes sp. NU459]